MSKIQQTGPIALPPLNAALTEILGRPSSRCGNIAYILRKGGQDIRPRPEDEQAAAVYFLLDIYLKHGDGWHKRANEALNAITRDAARREASS
jgi:hypothetical protein